MLRCEDPSLCVEARLMWAALAAEREVLRFPRSLPMRDAAAIVYGYVQLYSAYGHGSFPWWRVSQFLQLMRWAAAAGPATAHEFQLPGAGASVLPRALDRWQSRAA